MGDVIVVENESTGELTIAQRVKALILQYPYVVASIIIVICIIVAIVVYNPGNIIGTGYSKKSNKSLEGNIDRMIGSIMDKQQQALSANAAPRR